jgi:hypothetical protein
MVRTDLKTRPAALDKVYENNTSLKLKRVDSTKSLKYVRKAIDALKNKELDGIIAVDMLGEGFDFPNLKIAAVHSPHKSLAATLQFVGRFARTGSPTIGQAKFVTVTQEIKGELKQLWTEGSEWHEIIPMLNDDRVQRELDIRATISSFHADETITVDEETEDLSLYSIRPFTHVKIYRVAADLDITAEVDLVRGLEIKHREVSDDDKSVVLITKEVTQPKWASPGRFRKVEYDLFIVHIDRDHGLLFICTSRRREMVYRQIVKDLTSGSNEILAVNEINRVLNDIENAEAFSVGMRNRMQGATESYRIMAGPKADKAITPNDSRMYHRGHVMFRGKQGGIDVTVGLSSASKVWSNSYLQIPHLLQWCHDIAIKLSNTAPTKTNTNYDLLPMAVRINTLPDKKAIGVDWDGAVYINAPLMLLPVGENVLEVSLLDAEIKVERDQQPGSIQFSVNYNGSEWPFEFALTPTVSITPSGWVEEDGPTVQWEEAEISLLEFLLVSLPTFYFSDFSSLIGVNYLAEPEATAFFDPNRVEVIDWPAFNVDIEAERHRPSAGKISIHAYVSDRLRGEGHKVVVYDDGSGEVADFVAIDETVTDVRFTLYHAKGSHGAQPGERVADVYEVCGQSVKCIRWTLSAERLIKRLLNRATGREAEWVIVGNRADLSGLLTSVVQKKVSFEIVIVQPGISRARLQPDNIAIPLASADLFIREGGAFETLRVWGSA